MCFGEFLRRTHNTKKIVNRVEICGEFQGSNFHFALLCVSGNLNCYEICCNEMDTMDITSTRRIEVKA